MVELFECDVLENEYQSSKGNQLKWKNNNHWYKADYSGYEGLAEYLVSSLLEYSTLSTKEYTAYQVEEISYKRSVFRGAVSEDFLFDDWQIITLERLFQNRYNRSFYQAIWSIKDVDKRFRFICSEVEKMTGLQNFGRYLNILFTIDAFFLNEDRHMHNIAVLMNSRGDFAYCNIFDNGACLLSDTTMDYPMSGDVYELISESHSKTISRDYAEQLDVSERIAGRNISFSFAKKDVEVILEAENVYGEEEKERVRKIVFEQMRRYSYLFT